MATAKREGRLAETQIAGIQGAQGTPFEHERLGQVQGRGKERFQRTGQTVKHRNQEFKALTRHAAESDVSTESSGGVLWTGDKRDEEGNVEVSAMKTAQAYAEANDKKTVEMTAGGGALDRYTQEDGNSYGDIVKRFNYLADEEREPEKAFDPSSWSSAKELMDPTIQTSAQQTGDADLDGVQASAEKNPAANVWDVLSKRFAGGLSGETLAVHGYDESQHEALTAGPLANNTFNGIEKPTVEAKGQADLIEVFGTDQDMQKYKKRG